MKDIKKVFSHFEKMLRESNWFNDDWAIYNRGPYLQLYKDNWHNHAQGGIHFETSIEAPQIQKKAFPIALHVEEDCPQQQQFVDAFLALEAGRIGSWKGYDLGEGYCICSRTLPLNFKNLEQRLLEEMNRLRQLEASIDQVLRTLEG